MERSLTKMKKLRAIWASKFDGNTLSERRCKNRYWLSSEVGGDFPYWQYPPACGLNVKGFIQSYGHTPVKVIIEGVEGDGYVLSNDGF